MDRKRKYSVIVEGELIIQLYNNYAKEQAINAITYKCEQDGKMMALYSSINAWK